MGSVPTPKVAPTPPPPETVRRADADARKLRNKAKADVLKFGPGGSDLTRGALAATGPVLKQTLGGGGAQ
jgi:hypothetical protein